MIELLVLENYTPLLSSGVKKITIRPDKDINLLVSTNGTGKSSILKQLNPLPPENGDFGKNGRKLVKISMNGNSYILDCFTGKGNGHSFKFNGKELNGGGTLTAQKELVQNHFKLNANLNKILSGIKVPDLLSAMSAGRRKDIFMSLYPNDTDYALSRFNLLKEERNNLKGAIKNQVNRYTEERRKLDMLSQYSVEQLEQQIAGIEVTIKDALLLRGALANAQNVHGLQEEILKLERVTNRILLTRLTNNLNSEDELERELIKLDRLLDYNSNKVTHYEALVAERNNQMSGLDLTQNPDQFKAQLAVLAQDLETSNNSLRLYDEKIKGCEIFNEEDRDWNNYITVSTDFHEHLRRVTLASIDTLTGGTYKQWIENEDRLGNHIRIVEQKLSENNHKLKHYESADLVNCPDCNSKFKVGITQEDIDNLKRLIEAQVGDIDRSKEKLTILKRQIENDADWYMSMNQLFVFIRENGHVRVLSEIVKEYAVGKAPTERLLNISQWFVERFKLQSKVNALLEEQKVLKGRLALLEKNNMGEILRHLAYAEEQLFYYTNGRRLYLQKRNAAADKLKVMRDYDVDIGVLADIKKDIVFKLAEQGRFDLRHTVDGVINQLTPQKNKLMTDIIRFSSLNSVVESIDDDIKRLKTRLKKVEILMNGLCPNKGLIGKLMSEFITSVCANMNAVIRKVWSGPLYIKPCSKENGDLTYKFPVINGDNSENSDVVDCSAGESEMIDFAFRYVILNYHNADYPLFMDEVGVYFDEIHRGRFLKFIERYTSSNDSKQLFMVSHYISQYGLFVNPNIISINSEGLTIKGEINKNTTIG